MATRDQLRELADLRLREAETLFAAKLYDGCVYLCGYVVEAALKARICTVLNVAEYPEEMKQAFWTHNFDHLRLLAGLKNELALASGPVFDNWSLVTSWKTENRYDPPGTSDWVKAQKVLEAVRSDPYGVFTWLRKRW